MGGGFVLPHVTWFQLTACSPSWPGWKTMGGSAGLPSTASKVTMTWVPESTQWPKRVVVPLPGSSVTVAEPSDPRLKSIDGPTFASSSGWERYVPTNFEWVVVLPKRAAAGNSNTNAQA